MDEQTAKALDIFELRAARTIWDNLGEEDRKAVKVLSCGFVAFAREEVVVPDSTPKEKYSTSYHKGDGSLVRIRIDRNPRPEMESLVKLGLAFQGERALQNAPMSGTYGTPHYWGSEKGYFPTGLATIVCRIGNALDLIALSEKKAA